ncbi:methylated-DNA--[protein]-cysteine S-methyltransferase [Demequina subtropica]|uniref:methylated-DNA--[protein]-cysteine S-methyltransferase n=1 Tax=Demequina subtropica TaxID=1638989 RepID=UPI000784EAF9|nr:methylated-DNA--[protein]-cysteine S-methyltransferase [Demequina subtropica]
MTSAPLIGASYETPFGTLTVLATPEDGVVRSSGFRTMRDTVAGLPAPMQGRGWEPGELPHVAAAIAAWLDGDGDALASVPIVQQGGPFFQEVWEQLRTVPSGSAVSYQELATMAGRPRAMRAAGTACARNNIAPFVPCHRVVQSGGRLGSYGFGGTEVKAAMLALEGAWPLPARA